MTFELLIFLSLLESLDYQHMQTYFLKILDRMIIILDGKGTKHNGEFLFAFSSPALPSYTAEVHLSKLRY